MRDDFTIPNMGEAPANYDKGHINRVVRNVEMTFRTAKSKGPATFTELTADNFNVNTITSTSTTTYTLRVNRVGSEDSQYYTFSSTSVGHLIQGFSDPANAKPFIFDSTTDALNTAPSGGANAYAFRIRGVDKLTVNDSSLTTIVGMGFGSATASGGATDLSRHIALWGTSYGFSVTSNTINYVMGGNIGHDFINQGNVIIRVSTQGGIIFPGTQIANSNANALDDYEEGTWTPEVTFTTPGTLAVTYTTQTGSYVKIGQLVHLKFVININTISFGTATGEFRISGVPFAALSAAGENTGAVELNTITLPGTRTQTNLNLPVSATYCRVVATGSTQSRASLQVADMTGIDILVAEITYRATA